MSNDGEVMTFAVVATVAVLRGCSKSTRGNSDCSNSNRGNSDYSTSSRVTVTVVTVAV